MKALAGPAVVAVLALFVTACDDTIASGIVVDNRTDAELHFSVLLADRWYTPPGRAEPGETERIVWSSVLPPSGCTTGGMVALASDGRELARHDAPLCIGDVWVIEDVSPSGSSE